MEQQQAQQVEQQLRQNWRQIRYRILDQFGQVSTADLDASTSVNDLVARIADKTNHSERYVENRIQELVGAGSALGGASRDRLGSSQYNQFSQGGQGGQQQGQPFGAQQ
ncbi:hypothetical protein MXD62_06845 [Frankia sp. Mgl5]|uniref:hypothetical protein n=1 Tax=Frankia sp. Mgl5 TaxID=2933793 RepID=UPI00200EC854|nr:hypothetical protein [Frankia sp. Mgl5]MCK9926885.1 hypothetical protein [Frankia sp. Mgl5]